MRVLYVDDDRINALLFEAACNVAGDVEVEVASSGSEALQRAPEWQPELLVIDLHLPDTTGFELLPALRRQAPSLAEVPAFLCTADAEADIDQAALAAAGYRGCWPKPTELQFLKSALAELDTARRI